MTSKRAMVPPARARRLRHRQRRLGALLLAACIGLGGCSVVKKTQRMFGGNVLVGVSVDKRLNEDFPVAVDLVVVYDRNLLEELQAFDAATWFETEREQYLNGVDSRLEIRSWEWVPDREVETQTVSHRQGARAGVVFAHYFGEGEHRVTVEPLKHFHLDLGETDFMVRPLEGKKSLAKMEKIKKKQAKKARRQAKKQRKKGDGSGP